MKGLLTSTALAAMLALNLGGASPAFAVKVFHTVSPTGDHVYTSKTDDEKKVLVIHVYDEDHKYLFSIPGDSNPKPDGGDSGIVDVNALIEDAMKNGGGEIGKENHFLESTLGQNLIKHSKTGSIVPYHNPDPGSYMPGDGYGGGTGGGGFDPNNPTSIVDQMKKGKKKGKNKGKKKGKAPKPGYNFSANPALVNPVPIQLPVAKPAKTKVKQVSAPALIKKGKGPIGNSSKAYPTIPNLPSPAKGTAGSNSRSYPTIPNLPSPTAANKNRLSHVGTAMGRQPGAAAGNFQTMVVRGGARKR